MILTSISLLDRLKAAGPDASDWNRLQGIYLPLISRWLGRVPGLGVEADDLAQEVFVVVIRESWDRSTTWSQFRSTRRQRGWWLDGVRRDRRVRPHRSPRCKMRGVVPDPRCGVAKFAADGPGRLSTSVSRACWTGPPPDRSPRAATSHDRLARSSRRSPLGGAACGFWIRAWSHASPLFKQPAA
jgi:DNA-directed RNA polymerase specialized sigma24 family protein